MLWPPDAKSWLIWKDPDAGKDWGQEEKGMTEDKMAGWHHQLNGHGFVYTPAVGDGQGGLACYSSWGQRVGHDWVTELNWTDLSIIYISLNPPVPIPLFSFSLQRSKYMFLSLECRLTLWVKPPYTTKFIWLQWNATQSRPVAYCPVNSCNCEKEYD